MRIALITTPPSVRSGIGDYTRHLLPYLKEECDVDIFVDPRVPDREWEGEVVRTTDELRPREYDQLLYQLGNEQSHAFMAGMVRAIGGTVMQHDWVLFDMALTAYPALFRGGLKGQLLALREGGVHQAKRYVQNWMDRRQQRSRPTPSVAPWNLFGTLLAGWHEPEDQGRWTADQAFLRIPCDSVEEIVIELHVDAGRTVQIRQLGQILVEGDGGTHVLQPASVDHPLLTIETRGIEVTREQRRNGDNRRLGSFVQRVAWKSAGGVSELDLSQSSAVPNVPVTLSRDRFRLPFNRSIVRYADAFIVHSEYVRDKILRERNSRTAIGILHHGAEYLWKDEDRKKTRRSLGLPAEWTQAFLVTSFGGVQRHKRIDKALEALALARKERADIRMVLAGSLSAHDFDPLATVDRLDLNDAVHVTGFVEEEDGWRWLHAGNVALNLRGPTSGGTSGGIFQAFSLGRPVIASDAAEQRELPDSCVLKIPLGGEEVRSLAAQLVALHDDPERLANLERGARSFVEEECHWSLVAKEYARYLEGFPKARASRRGLVSMRLASRSA